MAQTLESICSSRAVSTAHEQVSFSGPCPIWWPQELSEAALAGLAQELGFEVILRSALADLIIAYRAAARAAWDKDGQAGVDALAEWKPTLRATKPSKARVKAEEAEKAQTRAGILALVRAGAMPLEAANTFFTARGIELIKKSELK